MISRKNIFGGVILIFIGIALVYYVYRKGNKSENEPVKNKQPDIDSVKQSNREDVRVEIGAKPEKNSKDGSVKIVEEFIKSNTKNPETFEFLEWSEVMDEDGYWKVRCKYRGVSSFNAEVTTNAWFYIRNNKVVYTKIISKI